MTLPAEIQGVLAGLESSSENLKTASASDVFRYENRSSGSVAFLKVQRPSWSPPLSREAETMEWLSGKLPVPEVIAYHKEDEIEYLVTKAIPGMSSEDKRLVILMGFRRGTSRMRITSLLPRKDKKTRTGVEISVVVTPWP